MNELLRVVVAVGGGPSERDNWSTSSSGIKTTWCSFLDIVLIPLFYYATRNLRSAFPSPLSKLKRNTIMTVMQSDIKNLASWVESASNREFCCFAILKCKPNTYSTMCSIGYREATILIFIVTRCAALFSVIISPITVLCFGDRICCDPHRCHLLHKSLSDVLRAFKPIPGELMNELSMTQTTGFNSLISGFN